MTKADMSDRVVRKGIFEKVAFDYKSEGSLGASHMDTWRKNIPERENSMHKQKYDSMVRWETSYKWVALKYRIPE